MPGAAPVTHAFCTCPLDHPCYRSDVRECYEFADGPDGLCGRCRGRPGTDPQADIDPAPQGRGVTDVTESL
jgi:hypothetical protein